jgi:hypothetical protein
MPNQIGSEAVDPRRTPADRNENREVAGAIANSLRIDLSSSTRKRFQNPQGTGDRLQARLEVRHHVHIVLSVTARAQARHALRHAALARPSICRTSKSASDASDFFQIPTGRVVEIGTQVTI